MSNPFQALITYLKEVRQEANRVTWPTREETIRMTIVVIIISGFVAAVLGAFDLVFDRAALELFTGPTPSL